MGPAPKLPEGRARFKALTLAAGSFAALLAGELALCVAGFSFDLRPLHTPVGRPAWRAAIEPRYRNDADLLWVRSGYPQFLARARAEGPATFAFLGDSCTEYGGYPERVLEGLRNRRPQQSWTGWNFGTGAWSTFQGLRQLRRDVLPLRPRVITIYFGWNDHWVGHGLTDADVARLVRWSSFGQGVRLAQLATKAYVAVRRAPDNRRVPLAEFRRALEEMTRLARDHQIQPVLLTAPSAHLPGREPESLRGLWLTRLEELVPLHRAYADAVRAVAAEQGAVLCDLSRDFEALPADERRRSFLPDGIHFTRPGAARAAGFLVACFDSSGVLDRAAAPPR